MASLCLSVPAEQEASLAVLELVAQFGETVYDDRIVVDSEALEWQAIEPSAGRSRIFLRHRGDS